MPEAPNAVRELAEDPTSRKRFLRQAGGTGVAASLAAFIAACGGNDSSSSMSSPAATATPAKTGTEQFGKGDLGIANYALTLEYLETEFYAKAAESGMLKGKVLETAKLFGAEEQAHVEALTARQRTLPPPVQLSARTASATVAPGLRASGGFHVV